MDPGACEDELHVSYYSDQSSNVNQMKVTEPKLLLSPYGKMTIELSTCYRVSPDVITDVDLRVEYEELGRFAESWKPHSFYS